MPLSFLLNKWVLGMIGAVVLAAGVAYGLHRIAEHYRDEGRAEVRLEFDQYKAKVLASAMAAKQAVDVLSAQHQSLSDQLAKKQTIQLAKINPIIQEAQRVIETTVIADCALPDGVRDAINAARRGAASEIDRAYQPQGALQRPATDNR